jgi:alpha-galactosidase
LLNRGVISVDQDGIDASRLVNSSTEQVFAKTEKNGDVVAGLFNTSGASEVISVAASALGLGSSPDYTLNNLWTHRSTETTGTISVDVPSHGVALLRIAGLRNPAAAPPAAALNLTGLNSLSGGHPATATETFTNNGPLPALDVRLGLQVPFGWSRTATTPASFAMVDSGQTVQATFEVTAPVPTALFATSAVTGTARYTWARRTPQALSVMQQVTTSPPVQAPYLTYSSATDAPAVFGQSGPEFGISGAGADLYSGTDAYSTIYQPGAVGTTATVTTEVTSQQNMTGYAKAGIIVRNDMTGSGTTPEGVILFESPSGGIQLEWDGNSGTYINSVTPSNGANPELLPVRLKLLRNGSTYTGYYSFDGTSWLAVGSATVPGQASTQDAGMFLTSHAAGSPGEAVFNGFSVTTSDTPPPAGTAYLAASPTSALAGGAAAQSCSTCYGGEKVGYVGEGGTLTFNDVTVATTGTYDVTIIYCDGSATGRQATVSVDGGAAQTLSFTPTGSFTMVGAMTVPVSLAAGGNTIEFANPAAYAPDFNEIIVASSP